LSLLDKLRGRNAIVQNVEPNRVHTVGLDDIKTEVLDNRSNDWVQWMPPKIKPTIKNRRKASMFPSVYGILSNLIMKTISSYVIDGDNQESIDCILEAEKFWNLRNLMYECLWKNLVDGEVFYEITSKEGHVALRLLAFDGEKALIKKIYDEDGVTVKGYKQLVVRKSALKKWKNVKFWETYQDSEVITVDFEPDEISNPILIEIDGVGQSLVKNVIDIAYYLESLARQMPTIVFKSANIVTATFGNADRGEYNIDEETRDYVADQLSNYHNKGVVTLPWGITVESVGNPVLPKVEEYIKSLKAMLYEGLVTPESLYSSESSNRSTAQIQLTDPSTGHILFIEFCQEFLKEWVERTLIDPELEKHGKEKGSAYLTFQTNMADLDTNYLESGEDGDGTIIDNEPKNMEGSTAITTDPHPYETHKRKSEA
jgi:hypothetical protein